MPRYIPKTIEQKWQKIWEREKTYQAVASSKKPKYYCLVEFPFPSGDGLHVGHVRSYTAMDVIARKRRMQGYTVIYPIGWDAFGLPTENYAIKTGIHPTKVTKTNTDNFRRQLKSIGFSFDWSREVNTSDPSYYRWTQWMFLQFLKKGLAYKAKVAINWCPKDKIGLANEEVIGGNCERCGTSVEQRLKEQWMIKITKYAEKLLSGLKTVDFLPEIKKQQENWIGKSEGVVFTQKIKDLDIVVEAYDSIPQTFLAQTFCMIAPEHPLLPRLVEGTAYQDSVSRFVEDFKKRKASGRFNIETDLSGIFTGRYIENPFGTGDLPLWVSTFVLSDYGTGFVNGSAHDERDFLFAKKYNIPLRPVLFPSDKELAQKVRDLEFCYGRDEQGILQEPAQFKGRMWGEVRRDVIAYIEKNKLGRRSVQYRLRDWVFSRQRYWGEPIPVIICDDCGYVPVPEKDLPVVLPNVKNYQPRDDGQSPLASVAKWVNVKCPQCKKPARRETDVMPNWAGSSWYFLRYIDPKNKKQFASPSLLKKYMPVDWYNGGMEHVTLHLLYSRFWNQFLHDCGFIPVAEPYKKRTAHGLILAEGGVKMSKSKGNVVSPDIIVRAYGADVLRLYELFVGPFDQAVAWDSNGVEGANRFLQKVWNIGMTKIVFDKRKKPNETPLTRLLHKTIKQVTDDIELMRFNTAVSACMIFVNECQKQETISHREWGLFLKLLSPFAPHMTEELWANYLKEKHNLSLSAWPTYEKKFLEVSRILLPVQVNGKLRDQVEIESGASQKSVEERVLASTRVQAALSGKKPIKIVYVPNRIINIVI